MGNTKTTIKETPPISHPAFPYHPDPHLTCHRCQGLFAQTFYLDIDDTNSANGFWALRCLQCGEVIDPLILKNRTVDPRSVLTGGSRQDFPIALK
jgi:hypothetical protein